MGYDSSTPKSESGLGSWGAVSESTNQTVRQICLVESCSIRTVVTVSIVGVVGNFWVAGFRNMGLATSAAAKQRRPSLSRCCSSSTESPANKSHAHRVSLTEAPNLQIHPCLCFE